MSGKYYIRSPDHDPRFAELVREQLCQLNPDVRDQIRIVPSLRNVSELECDRYLAAKELDWDVVQRQSLLDKMSQTRQKLTNFDPVEGFNHVKFTELKAGKRLVEAGSPSGFVYISLGDGLRIIPLGGYPSFSVTACLPLLMIPKEIYLRNWYVPYAPSELKDLLRREAATGSVPAQRS